MSVFQAHIAEPVLLPSQIVMLQLMCYVMTKSEWGWGRCFLSLKYFTEVFQIYQNNTKEVNNKTCFKVFLRKKKLYVRNFLQFEVRSITILGKHLVRLYLSYVLLVCLMVIGLLCLVGFQFRLETLQQNYAPLGIGENYKLSINLKHKYQAPKKRLHLFSDFLGFQ